jgi:hypothetical protein
MLVISANLLTSCSNPKADIKPVMTLTFPDLWPTVPETASVLTIATKKAVGHWKLVSTYSVWTGQNHLPLQNIDLVIDDQLQAIYYEEGKEVARYTYQLKQVGLGIRYSVVNQIGKPEFYMDLQGDFRVGDQNLIVGDTGLDGGDYVFDRK